jgi:hypothetical protein
MPFTLHPGFIRMPLFYRHLKLIPHIAELGFNRRFTVFMAKYISLLSDTNTGETDERNNESAERKHNDDLGHVLQ